MSIFMLALLFQDAGIGWRVQAKRPEANQRYLDGVNEQEVLPSLSAP
jgi:hypothetical protein